MEQREFELMLHNVIEQAVRACRTCADRNKCLDEVAKAKVIQNRLDEGMPWCAHAAQAWALAFADSSKYDADVARLAEDIAREKEHTMVTAGDVMQAFATMLQSKG
jgi:hypothetical protein